VIVDNAVSRKFTVVDVFTRDRMGLLHVIAKTLHDEGLSIALSKISTEGEKAADVFYVQDADGGKLRDPKRLEALAASLRAALDGFHAREDGAEAQA
jgi:[protein-PII] uridylyltransferase